MEEKGTPLPAQRHKHRYAEEQKALLSRLRRAEGQIRGIQRMVENDAYCPDILIQVSAVTSALRSFSRELMGAHLRECVVEDIRSHREDAVDELVTLVQRMMK